MGSRSGKVAMMTAQFRQVGIRMSPLKRLGLPKDIADVVASVAVKMRDG